MAVHPCMEWIPIKKGKSIKNCYRMINMINHESDKDQQIKDLKMQLQKQKDTGKILLKDNAKMK